MDATEKLGAESLEWEKDTQLISFQSDWIFKTRPEDDCTKTGLATIIMANADAIFLPIIHKLSLF